MDTKLSASLEDYLETIYYFIEQKSSVKAIDISRSLGVSRASVTEALKKLSEKELINYARYELISLTQKGVVLAKDIINKHKLLTKFFEKVLEANNSEAQELACKIEHIISQNMMKRVERFTEFYEKDIPEDIKDKFLS